MTENIGRSLELFFIDGKPDGMLTAEVFNWTGHLLVTPRTQIRQALSRSQSSYTGVYLLVGDEQDRPKLYVGEGENIATRIRSHESNKDWWTKCILITSQANNLHKAHVQYLEARLVQEANKSGIIDLDNSTTPNFPTLSESAKANMESFLDYLFMVLPAVRIDLFLKKVRPKIEKGKTNADDPEFELRVKKENILANAILVDGEFVVQEGSLARSEWVGGDSHNYSKLYAELSTAGVIKQHGDTKVFTTNYAFSSTSAAGAMITGRATAGPIAWKLKGTNKTYRDWEQDGLSIE
jgi:hypothetical protein